MRSREAVGGDGAATTSREFFDVTLRQRASRQFNDQPVSEALIERCLQAAVHAPSAENRQPWVFVVVRDAHLRATIGDLSRRAWRQGGRQHSEGRLSPSLLRDVDRGAEGGIGSAPVIVVVCGDADIGLESTLPSSVYPATQNLLLAATALGLGSAMTTLATLFADELRTLLDLPLSIRPMAVVPIGWPNRPLGPPQRLPLRERAYRDRYGCPW
ncbi:MAG: nitroreductase family protein [Acidimicrobiales bacterium]|nr:nitroreductase family protein [Acidimicrobiales bacterium]